MASLEMMNFLAADLPSSSPLKRSYTLNPKRLTRNPGGGREGREVTRKPPLPKLSLVGVAGAGGHLVSPSDSPSCNSSQSNIPGMYSTLPPSLPHTPRTFSRQNSVPTSSSTSSRQCRPSDLPSKLISAFEGVLCSSPGQHRRGLDSSLVIEETDNSSVTSLYSSDTTTSPRAYSEDRLSGQEFLHSVTSSSPVPLPQLRGERGERGGDLSLDSGVVTSPSPPTDSGIALLSPATSRNRNNQEDSASVISCSLSEASDTSGSRYDNVAVMSSSPGETGKRGVSPGDLSDSSQENCLDNNNSHQSERQRDSTRDSGPYENLTPEILSNVYSKSGLNSLRKILTNGQTTNV